MSDVERLTAALGRAFGDVPPDWSDQDVIAGYGRTLEPVAEVMTDIIRAEVERQVAERA